MKSLNKLFMAGVDPGVSEGCVCVCPHAHAMIKGHTANYSSSGKWGGGLEKEGASPENV